MQPLWHKLTTEDVYRTLETSVSGLLADTIRSRQRQYGQNQFPKKQRAGAVTVIGRQFTSPLMLLLLLATVASLAIGQTEDAVVIILAAVLNGAVGFIQEWKAERSAAALSSYEIPQARVRRGGKVSDIPARDLVPGDLVLLQAGSRVPADVRLIQTIDTQIDESLLTGESFPVTKQTTALTADAVIGDRVNMAFLGTLMVRGRAEGVVVSIGRQTQLGEIAQLVAETKDEPTPLQVQLKRFSWLLGGVVVFVAVALFLVGKAQGISTVEILGVAIALAVASIPEGLLISLTVVLAIGMQHMLKRFVLVRRLVAAETLGSVSVVCTDKTGTLTEGRMSVAQVRTKDQIATTFTGAGDAVRSALLIGALNNDADVSEEAQVRMGHPTERALLDAALTAGISVEEARRTQRRIAEIPFTGERKYMVTQHATAAGRMVFVKGAPERVLAMCRMTEEDRSYWHAQSREMAQQGLRVLAVAQKAQEEMLTEPPTELVCQGLIGISDVLRPSTRASIRTLNQAGVRVVLITGDHPETAMVVAQDAGMTLLSDGVVLGVDLDQMSDDQLKERVVGISVYARVEPQHKLRIIQAWRARGEVVAMVGDGVNDAAAMKAADIGVSVGSGTDVAKETSDMVLLNNDLSSITAAVYEGRVIFDNIRKVIVYLVADSFSEVVLISGTILLGLPLPILAVQILWINLVTDGLPYLALTMERAEPDVMQRPPRRRDAPVVNTEMKVLIFLIGVLTDIGLLTLYLFLQAEGIQTDHLRTIIFTALAVDSLLYVFAVRSLRRSLFRMNPFTNRWLVGAVLIGLLTQVAVVYVPWLQDLFRTIGLSASDWGLVGLLAVIKLIAIEVGKEGYLLIKKRKHAT